MHLWLQSKIFEVSSKHFKSKMLQQACVTIIFHRYYLRKKNPIT